MTFRSRARGSLHPADRAVTTTIAANQVADRSAHRRLCSGMRHLRALAARCPSLNERLEPSLVFRIRWVDVFTRYALGTLARKVSQSRQTSCLRNGDFLGSPRGLWHPLRGMLTNVPIPDDRSSEGFSPHAQIESPCSKPAASPGSHRFGLSDLVVQPEVRSSCLHEMAAQSIMGGL